MSNRAPSQTSDLSKLQTYGGFGRSIAPINYVVDGSGVTTGTVSTSGTLLTCSTANFQPSDVGLLACVPGAGATVTFADGSTGGGPFNSPIVTWIDAHNVRLRDAMPTTLTNAMSILVYGVDETAAFQSWVAACWALGIDGVAADGNYIITAGIDLTPDPEPIAFQSAHREVGFKIGGTVFCQASSFAFRVIGSILGPWVELGSLIGPGVTALGAVGSGAEYMGLCFNRSSARVRAQRITDFNFGVMFDGAFANILEAGTVIACYSDIHQRVGSATSRTPGANSVANQISFTNLGGIITNYLASTFAIRAPRSSHYGLYMDAGTNGSRIKGGACQYAVRYANSVAVYNAGHDNLIEFYTEGVSQNGVLIQEPASARNNTYTFGGFGTGASTNALVDLQGLGAVLNGMPSGMSDTVISSGNGGAYNGSVAVPVGNLATGVFKERIGATYSRASASSIVHTETAWTVTSGTAAIVTGLTDDLPDEVADLLGIDATELTVSTITPVTFRSPVFSTNGDPLFRARAFFKVYDEPLVINPAVYAQSPTPGMLQCKVTQLANTQNWTEIDFVGQFAGAATFYAAAAVRWKDAGTGASRRIRICAFQVCTNIAEARVHNPVPLTGCGVSPYRNFPDGFTLGRQIARTPQAGKTVGGVADFNYRDVFCINAPPDTGGTTISGFNNVRKDSIITLQNSSGVTYTVAGSLIGTSVTMLTGTAIRLIYSSVSNSFIKYT